MNQKHTIKELMESERPYEKCERLGAGNLSDAELLAVLLRTGTRGENVLELCRRILEAGDGSLESLHSFTREAFQKIRGGHGFCTDRLPARGHPAVGLRVRLRRRGKGGRTEQQAGQECVAKLVEREKVHGR